MNDNTISTYNNIWKEDVVKNLNYTKVLCQTCPYVKKKHCQRRGFPTTTRHRKAAGGLNLR